MTKSNVEEIITRAAEPLVTDLGLELVDVQFVKEGASRILRIFIDKEGGITHEDCGRVSEAINPCLDELDPIAESYYLEVSSPGLERPLTKDSDYVRFAGQKVLINTYAPVAGSKQHSGRLKGLQDGTVILNHDGQEIMIPREAISRARLEVEF